MAFDTKSQMRIATTVIRSEQEAIQRSRSQKQARGYNAVPQPILGIASQEISALSFGQVAIADGAAGLSDSDLSASTEIISAYNPSTESIEQEAVVFVAPVIVRGARQAVWRILVTSDTETTLPTVTMPHTIVARLGSTLTFDCGTDDVAPSNGKLVELGSFEESGDPGWVLDEENFYLRCVTSGDYWVTIGGILTIYEKPTRNGEWFAEFCGFHWSKWTDEDLSWGTGFINSVDSSYHFGGTNTSVRVDVTHTMSSFPKRTSFVTNDRIRLICSTEQIRRMDNDALLDGEASLSQSSGGWVKVERIIE